MADNVPLGSEAKERASLYGLLSRMFRTEPGPELIRHFRSPAIQKTLEDLNLAMGREFMETDEKILQEELGAQYTRLFLAPPTHLPPYESCFVGGINQPKETFEPSLQGKAALETAAFYEAHGITFDHEASLFPDHIAVELDALRLLCDLEAEAGSRGNPAAVLRCRQTAARFLEEHVNRWVPLFCDAVLESAKTGFYAVAAKLTKSFIDAETNELAPCGVKQEEVTQ
ncbi:MAG: molecular chaperone TorD family protein [bacterium]|nr:molecular chaperone TorD family protein [bacterium]